MHVNFHNPLILLMLFVRFFLLILLCAKTTCHPNSHDCPPIYNQYPNTALSEFETMLKSYPKSPGALCGRAKALDRLAEKSKSNALVRQAIDAYIELIQQFGSKLTDTDFKEMVQRCIERQRFLGKKL